MKDEVKEIAKKLRFIGKVALTAATIAMAVYTLLPKYEKIEGLNESGFIKAE